jgi:hypothetical protein
MVKLEKQILSGLLGISASVWGVSTHADPLLDFTMFNPPPAAQRKIAEPVVSWVVRADPKVFCDAAQPRDGMAVRPEGCVVWQRKDSRCTIVTTERTTHSQLGHLFLLCLKAE